MSLRILAITTMAFSLTVLWHSHLPVPGPFCIGAWALVVGALFERIGK